MHRLGGTASFRDDPVNHRMKSGQGSLVNAVEVGIETCRKQGMAHDIEGETHQLRQDVKGITATRAFWPLFQHGLRLLLHDAHELSDLVTLKGRLRHSALPLPESAFTGQQTLAERKFQDAVIASLAIV